MLLLVAVIAISVQAGAYYYFQSLYRGQGSGLVSVSTLINYGSGPSVWYNNTKVPAEWNFYDLTVYLAQSNVEAQYYGPPLNEHYVTGINGVRNSPPFFWTLWIFCQGDRAWTISRVGADLIKLSDGKIAAWYYQVTSGGEGNWQPPVPGAAKVSTCSL